MSKCWIFLFLILNCTKEATAQTRATKATFFKQALTFNPLGLAEPQAAVGFGFNKMLTARSGYFTELSYIFRAPFYRGADPLTGGYRWLLQYRHHSPKANRRNHFWGAEFRLKGYGFTGTNTFINKASNDTLSRYPYKARATSVGGAILLGKIFDLGKGSRWQMEVTGGIGAKQKFVKYKSLPQGYELYVSSFDRKPDVLGPPDIDEAVGMPYFPMAVRFRYRIL